MKRFISALLICILLIGAVGLSEEMPEGFDPGYIAAERGSRGDVVTAIQRALIDGGYLSGDADGVFGKQTEAAVKAWQAANGFESDGRLTAGQFRELCPESLSEEYIEGFDNAPGWEVYVSPAGEKYHRYNCYTIREHLRKGMSRAQAEQEGYKPCLVCRPDR